MTRGAAAPARQSGLVWLTPNDARIVGTPAQVASAVAAARATGRLVAMSAPVAAGRGAVLVNLRLKPEPRVATPKRRRRAGLIVAGVAVTVGLTGMALWAVVQAVAWVAAHLAQIGGVAAVVVLLLGLLSRTGACQGIVAHCRGCRG